MTSAALKADTNQVALLIDKVDQVAVLPHVVYKVLEVSNSSDAPAADMERAITVDPGFSSKVLALANSAAFGLPKRVTSIKEAVMFLGFKTIRNIALTVGVFDFFVGKTDKESLRRRAWWRHSIDTAVCCRWLSHETLKARPDEAYTCGLLHLIGKTLLDRYGEQDYGKVMMMTEQGFPDYLAERQLYGCHHVDVTQAAAKKWALPEALVSGMYYLEAAQAEDPYATLRATTAIGTRIATLARENSSDCRALPSWAMALLAIPAEREEPIIEEGIAIVGAAQMQI